MNCKKKEPPTQLLSLEKDKDLVLDLSWYDDKSLYTRPRGITFYIRACNEEKTIAQSIESLQTHLSQRKIPFDVVLIDNNSTDATVLRAREALRPQDRVVFYPLQVAKPGLENAVTPPNSAHSFVWFTQFALQQCTRYTHAFRWDADFLMTTALADALKREFTSPHVVPNDFYSIRALHCESGKANREYYLIAVRTRVRYVLRDMWETWSIPCKRPHKAAMTDRECIEHVTDIHETKDYQERRPWWIADIVQKNLGCEQWFIDMIAQYEQIKATLPPGVPTYARSHCQKTDILQSFVPSGVKKIQGLPQ